MQARRWWRAGCVPDVRPRCWRRRGAGAARGKGEVTRGLGSGPGNLNRHQRDRRRGCRAAADRGCHPGLEVVQG